jgi:beta-fructofuranosidase
MTIPRELKVINNRLYQNPVRELEQYYQNEIKYDAVTINGKKEFEDIHGRELDFTVDVKDSDYRKFTVRLASDSRFFSEIIYNPGENSLTFDRTYSGLNRDIIHTRTMKVKDQGGRNRL